jgi:hypothetical protein
MYSFNGKQVIVFVKNVQESQILKVLDTDEFGVIFVDDFGVHCYIPYTAILMLIDRRDWIKAHPEGKE